MLIELAVVLVASQLPRAPAAEPTEPPTLIVQVVDRDRVPVPGVQIEVRRHATRETLQKATSDNKGKARFWIERDAKYDIEVLRPGFRKARVKAVRPLLTAHVQIRLKLGRTTGRVN